MSKQKPLQVGEWIQYHNKPAVIVHIDSFSEARVAVPIDAGGFRTVYVTNVHRRRRLLKHRWIVAECSMRSDCYDFYALHSPSGNSGFVAAGCRTFTAAQGRSHWLNRQRIYMLDHLTKNQELNTWSLAFVDRLERAMLKARKARK